MSLSLVKPQRLSSYRPRSNFEARAESKSKTESGSWWLRTLTTSSASTGRSSVPVVLVAAFIVLMRQRKLPDAAAVRTESRDSRCRADAVGAEVEVAIGSHHVHIREVETAGDHRGCAPGRCAPSMGRETNNGLSALLLARGLYQLFARLEQRIWTRFPTHPYSTGSRPRQIFAR